MVAQNATIYKEDYNTIQTQISNLLGTGSGDSGYGQTVTSVPVSSGTIISAQVAANQWVSLYADMLKVANHQGTNIGTLTTAYSANVKSGSLIQSADITKFSDTATTLVDNKLVAADLSVATSAGIDSSRTADWGGSPGPATVKHIITVTFTNYDALRAYFNSGGTIKFAASLNSSSPNQNLDWQSLLSSFGTITYDTTGSTRGGSYGTAVKIRPYDLTTVGQIIFQRTGAPNTGGAIYAANDYTIYASRNAGVLTFEIQFNDDHTTGSDPGWPYDKVTGTLTSTITYQKPLTTYITIPAPTFSTYRALTDNTG